MALKKITIPPTKSCTGSVIILHGSGGTGNMCKQMIKFSLEEELRFPHLQIHYPTAPVRRYSMSGGSPQNVWFDRKTLDKSSSEDVNGIDEIAQKLNMMIKEEVDSGIPINRIVVGGFSMGGAMALHYGLRFGRDLAGIFCLSSYLSTKSKVFEDLQNISDPLPPVFMAHGDVDPVVPYDWGKSTYERLDKGYNDIIFHRLSSVAHNHSMEELILLSEWINVLIPFHSLD